MTAASDLPSSIGALVLDAAKKYADDEAVADPGLGRRVSFAELATLVRGAASLVVERGVEPGDRIGIWAPNSLDWAVAALGAVSVGAALVPLNTRFKADEASWILDRAHAKLCFVSKPFLGVDYADALAGRHDTITLDGALWDRAVDPVVDDRVAAVKPVDTSDIIFTSGTTGKPKGVVTTHAQSIRVFETWADIVGLRHGDRYLIVNPFFHTFGYKAGILACLLKGATIVPQPVFDVDTTIDLIARESISVLPGPPTIYSSMLDRTDEAGRKALSSLRVAVTGAAIVPVALIEAMQRDLDIETVLTAYGLTEATGTATMCRVGDDAVTIATTSGRAIPDTEVRVVDPDGNEMKPGDAGEVVVRGYNVMTEYFEEPEATASTIREGWLHTGDIGVMDVDGNLTITDRLKDMYVVGGFNAYPAEIEQVLATHPAIAECAVVGMPDERLGEVGRAFVVARPGESIDEAELIAWCRERMANYKVPRSIVLIDALPRNASGKVRKVELTAR